MAGEGKGEGVIARSETTKQFCLIEGLAIKYQDRADRWLLMT